MYVHPNVWEETLVCGSRAVAAYSVNENEIRGLQMGTLTCMHACVYALKHASTHGDPSGPRFNFEIGTAGSLVGVGDGKGTGKDGPGHMAVFGI